LGPGGGAKLNQYSYTVVIATFNRAHLIGRAIASVIGQNCSTTEIIVVDDCSDADIGGLLAREYPGVRYIRQNVNSGPGPARNVGIRAASNEWVIILDDDDILLPNALETIYKKLDIAYPVINFSTTNGKLPAAYMVIKPGDYYSGRVSGDFTPVINKTIFLKENYEYPNVRIGGESLLWIKIAEEYGIPTWEDKVCRPMDDAAVRLTSFEHQIKRAHEYAHLQELIIREQEGLMRKYSPDQLILRRFGLVTYLLLSGDRKKARKVLSTINEKNAGLKKVLLFLLSVLPKSLIIKAFLYYRNKGRD